MINTLKGNPCGKAEAYEILKAFIKEQIELSLRKEISEESFDSPNWAFYQAYQAGLRKGLEKVNAFIPDQEK